MYLLLAGLLAAVLLIGSSQDSRAQANNRGSSASSDPLVLEHVRDAIIELRLEDAERRIYDLSSEDRRRPIVRVHLAATSLLRVMLNDRPTDYDRFLERSDSLLKALDERGGSSRHAWLKSEAYLQRLWVWSKKGDYARAAFAGNSAYVFAERAVEIDPKEYGAYKARGLLHMAVGAVPSTFQRFLRLLGYEGGIERGIRELQLAADSSRVGAFESTVYLATLDLYGYPSSLNAVDTYEALWSERPESPLVALLLADAYIRRRQAGRALDVAERGLDLVSRPEVEHVDYLSFYRAEALFRLNRFAEAIPELESYIAMHGGAALKARAHLLHGISLEMTGRREEAVAEYRRVSSDRLFEEDKVAARRADSLLASAMDSIDRRLVRARNRFNAGHEQEALQLYNAILREPAADKRHRGEAMYGIARVHHVEDRLEEAVRWYERTAREPGDASAKWAPWSLYHLAEVSDELGDRRKALDALDRLEDYPVDYDYRAKMENRARVFRLRLK